MPGLTRAGQTPRSTAAGMIRDRYAERKGAALFAGHWGFQYYMESYGFKALDIVRDRLAPGDVLILPQFNSNVPTLPAEVCSESASLGLVLCPCMTTMQYPLAAAFYGTSWGLLPFSVGSMPMERYDVKTVACTYELNPLIRRCQQEVKQHPDSADLLGKLGNALMRRPDF